MTSRRVAATDDCPAARQDVGLAAAPPTLRSIAAALLLAPVCAFAQQAAPAPDTTAAPATSASMAGTSTAPAPAAQEPASAPRRPGETTTGRPPAPTVPAPATTPTSAAPAIAPLPGDAVTNPPAATTTAPAAAPATPAIAIPRVAMPSTTAPATSGPGAGRPDAASLLQTILALLLVLGLLIGLAWLMKRYGPATGGGSANLRVVGALNLGGRERIMVVEVGDQWIVVGAAPGRVNALHTMPRQEGEASLGMTAGGNASAIPATRFSDWLKNTIDKRNAK